MKLKDQRGEVGDDDDSGSDDNQDDDVLDDDDIVVIDPDALGDDDDDNDDDPNDKGDDDKKSDDDPDKAGEDLKAELAKRDEEIKTMNRNFYGLRKKFKAMEVKTADKDTKFTRDQLKQMLDENREDPDVVLNIIEHVAKQISGDEAKTHVDAAELSKMKKDLDGYLTASWPDAFVEGSKDHQDIQQAKDALHLNDHPLGDYLAGAATMLTQVPDMIDNAKKEARESAITVEDNRKKTIKQNSLESGKPKSVPGKPPGNALEVAKQMGLSKSATKVYLQLRNKKTTATVEV